MNGQSSQTGNDQQRRPFLRGLVSGLAGALLVPRLRRVARSGGLKGLARAAFSPRGAVACFEGTPCAAEARGEDGQVKADGAAAGLPTGGQVSAGGEGDVPH